MTRVPTSKTIGWQQPVEDIVDELPLSPTKGKRYILSTDNAIYTCIKGGATPEWEGSTPKRGWYVYNKKPTPGYRLKYTGTKWVRDYQPPSEAIAISGTSGTIYYNNHGLDYPVHAIFFATSSMDKEIAVKWWLTKPGEKYRIRWESNKEINDGRVIVR